MALRAAVPLLICALSLRAQSPVDTDPVDVAALTEALSRTAANFAFTAPGLEADETLDQRGRRGFIEVLNGKIPTARNSDLKLPEEFRTHHVVSSYSLAPSGQAAVLHETRKIVEIDGTTPLEEAENRHALTVGLQSPDDEIQQRMLESFEHQQLEGAVTDFGQLILLFTSRRLGDYEFTLHEPERSGEEMLLVLGWRQTGGSQGLMLFDQRTAAREMMEGEIWFRADDLLPIRIGVKTRKALSKNYFLATEATVDYAPSRFGLVPASVGHRQYLNSFLMLENNLHYANYRRPGPALVP
jgi:hypothetical protein